MAQIKTTGNAQIDQATAEIAVALRDACPGQREQEYYDVAMRLRDAIMAGTRELDRSGGWPGTGYVPEPPLDNWMAGDRERVLAQADEAVERFQGRQDDSFMGPAL